MAKALGLDKDGNQKVMSAKDYAGDAVGQFALNSLNGMQGQMSYFYINKIGMAEATAGNVLLIAKIVDAFTDLIMGKIVENTNSKHGKARPWMLWMIIPTVLAIIGMFTVPNVSGGALMAYGILSNIFASAVCYTAVAVPYYTMIAFKTRSNEEKGKIGTFRSAVGYAVGVSLGIGLIPITNALGGDQRAWIIFASVLAVISGICMFIVFKTSKELYVESKEENAEEASVGILKGLGILIRNKYWIKITVVGVAMNVMYALIMAGPLFYAQMILGNDTYYSLINTVNLVPSILGFLTVGFIIKKFGLTKTSAIASVIGIVGCVIRCIFPGSLIVTLLAGSVVMYATIPLISCLPAMVLNTAEYNMYTNGVRIVGMTNASNSFVGKIGGGLGSASIGWILAIAGAAAAKGSANAMTIGVYAMNIYVPLAMFVIMLIVLATYNYDKKYEALMKSGGKKIELSE
ncbi:MAG: MFS transporter [Eubacteriales bacterium]|nr:MFS transporter [Eubacteriales bacterium]